MQNLSSIRNQPEGQPTKVYENLSSIRNQPEGQPYEGVRKPVAYETNLKDNLIFYKNRHLPW